MFAHSTWSRSMVTDQVLLLRSQKKTYVQTQGIGPKRQKKPWSWANAVSNLDNQKWCMIQLKGYIQQLRSLVPPKLGKGAISRRGRELPTAGLLVMMMRLRGTIQKNHDAFLNDLFFFNMNNSAHSPTRFPRAQAPPSRRWKTVFYPWRFVGPTISSGIRD